MQNCWTKIRSLYLYSPMANYFFLYIFNYSSIYSQPKSHPHPQNASFSRNSTLFSNPTTANYYSNYSSLYPTCPSSYMSLRSNVFENASAPPRITSPTCVCMYNINISTRIFARFAFVWTAATCTRFSVLF